MAEFWWRCPDLGLGDVGYSCQTVSPMEPSCPNCSAVRTQHGPFLVLGAFLLANIVRNSQEDCHIVFSGVLLRIESPNDGEPPASVDVETNLGELRFELGKGEVITRDGVSVKPALCPQSVH
jgi:hypothetical protein